jgi:stage V sporulation protein D (sporulation-specific penicillin-binding protein)
MTDNTTTEKAAQRPRKAMRIRIYVLMALCGIAAFFVLGFRLYDIQVKNSNHYETRALKSQLHQRTLTASRGTIYDANGKALAISAPVENVFISPLEIARSEEDVLLIAGGLSVALDVERDVITTKAAKTTSQYQVIKHKVEADEAQRVRDFISENKLVGI